MRDIRQQVEHGFTYHPPKDNQPHQYEVLRAEAKKLALHIVDVVPDGRERALAITKLEEAVFWANAGIARA